MIEQTEGHLWMASQIDHHHRKNIYQGSSHHAQQRSFVRPQPQDRTLAELSPCVRATGYKTARIVREVTPQALAQGVSPR